MEVGFITFTNYTKSGKRGPPSHVKPDLWEQITLLTWKFVSDDTSAPWEKIKNRFRQDVAITERELDQIPHRRWKEKWSERKKKQKKIRDNVLRNAWDASSPLKTSNIHNGKV